MIVIKRARATISEKMGLSFFREYTYIDVKQEYLTEYSTSVKCISCTQHSVGKSPTFP